jgi:hyaluronan synthase
VSTRRRVIAPIITLVALLATAAWGFNHTFKLLDGDLTSLEFIVLAAFVMLVFTSILPYFHRDVRGKNRHPLFYQEYVLTIVPAHNEDPIMFRAMLDSILIQTRWPDRLHIIENGNLDEGYRATLGPIVSDWRRENDPRFEVRYDFNPVGDKREAQAIAIKACPQATIHHTLDSDVELGNRHVIERGIRPFTDRQVMSACGFLLGKNQNKSLLTRLVDLGFIGSFLNGRASYSMVGSVSVNTGGLAFYRASVMRKYLKHYLDHRIFGRKMSYGDDAMWTRYAMLEGKTVFQRDAWGYTLHPENWTHLRKQRTRWHRSWFWGNLWLIRHFNPLKPVWLLTVWQMTSFVWFSAAIPFVLIGSPLRGYGFAWMFFVWMAVVGYLTTLPYLTVKRPDMRFREQLLNWLLSPLSVLLNFYIGWALRYVGLFTCLKTSWGTRQKIEVAIKPV